MDNNKKDWLSPKEVEQEYEVNLRQVYRLIERGKFNSTGQKRELKISRESVEKYKRTQEARQFVEQVTKVDDSQNTENLAKRQNQEVKTGLAMQIAARQNELEKLQERIYSLERDLRDASFERGRAETLEKQIDRMEAAAARQGSVIARLILAVVILAIVAIVAILILAVIVKR